MKSYVIHFNWSGNITIDADNQDHAMEIFDCMSINEIIEHYRKETSPSTLYEEIEEIEEIDEWEE